VRSVDAIGSYFFEFKRKIGEYFTRQNIKRNSVLPYAMFLEASIDVFTIHGAIYPIEHRILQGDGV